MNKHDNKDDANCNTLNAYFSLFLAFAVFVTFTICWKLLIGKKVNIHNNDVDGAVTGERLISRILHLFKNL